MNELRTTHHPGARILVVDDEENVRLSLSVILQKRGFSVATASGGLEAIARIVREPFDLVLTDLAMKDADGLEVLAKVRLEQPDSVAIMLTGFASLDSAIEAIRRGAYDYLPKPANVEDMLQTIERGLEKRRLALDLRRRNEELGALHRLALLGIGRVLATKSDLGEALLQVLEITLDLFATSGGAVLFGADLPGGRPISRTRNAEADSLLRGPVPADLAQMTLLTGDAATWHPELPAVLAVPLETSAGRLGALVMVDVVPRTWSDEQVQTARTVAGRLAVALENARLYRTLDDERETLRQILHAAGDGILGLDATGSIVFASRAASRLLGHGEEELRGRSLAQLVAPDALALEELRVRAQQSPIGLVSGDLAFRGAAGGEVGCDVLLSSASPGSRGRIRWVLSIRDSRERRRAEERRSAAFSHLTHELKTPLTCVIAYADLLERGSFGPLSPSQLGALAVMRRNGRQLETLIENVLGLVRIRQGAVEYRFEPLPLAELVEEVRSTFAPIALERGIELTVGGDLEAIVPADRRMLSMALNNLLFNALKFTEAGGRVGLQVSGGEGEVVLEVFDSGVGIPEEYQERIFEPHFQVDPSRGGSGLGLAIVRSVAMAHGGWVRVESRPGAGSRFRLGIRKLALASVGTASGAALARGAEG